MFQEYAESCPVDPGSLPRIHSLGVDLRLAFWVPRTGSGWMSIVPHWLLGIIDIKGDPPISLHTIGGD